MSPKGRDILKSMVGAVESARPEAPGAPPPHRPSGAVKAMNLSLGRLGEEAAAAKALRESLASGDKVLEIDPAAVEMSFIRDRIPVDMDPEFERLKQSIQESGQQVPILVRPDPVTAGHYQAAYGHRRLRAAAEIGVPIKAVVRKLTDEELILAQGQENGPRVDLSFIERALFARRMDEHGFSRDMIAQALATDKPETSRLLQVAQTIDPEIILAIGPAPKVGRPRWLAFAEKFREAGGQKKARAAVGAAAFQTLDSNSRFDAIWKALEEKSAPQRAEQTLRTQGGRQLASVTRSGKTFRITVKSAEFSEFLAQRLVGLAAEFEEVNEVK
ncbi:plasmid partitioning protein RepB [Rhizobium lentis]|uniref:ParB family chromosome partitioning protein n=1 Tax=Rhizobium lentis TaxID=1138194 RepID=A0A7W8XGT3_9HYPH|nr:plasmid partitioning protein RepB [Rhizobium lentis]MBB4575883.1 ParB family chromosome partitioning protein [Rhizobium lentis]MBB5552054.1 ParB family chromosome partitioning protein [Rhizobium lentis]MBB5562592.1 ParB family chromosome partitioning protein [Rhizobium lentis]MBB5569861.1 ParB family chromosome partitioning protein [Rhizobium lentis]